MAGTMMAVGCKLPHGLVLRLQIQVTQKVNIGGVAQDVRLWVHDTSEDAEVHKLAGFARRAAMVPSSRIVGAHQAIDGGTIGGYAISYVPKDFWDKWAAQNKDFPPFKNGTIVAWEKLDSVEGHAREHLNTMSGMEPFNPLKPPPEFSRGRITEAAHT